MVTSLDGLTVSKRASENGRSHWSLAAGLTQDSFLTPSETTASERGVQQTDGMHPALQQPQLPDRQKGLSSPPPRLPARQSTPQTGGVLSCEALPHCLIPHVLPTDYYVIRNLTDFLQGNTTMSRKCFQELLESGNMGFYATEINLFLTGKNVLTLIVPINSFDYNDLKCTAWICNFFYF